jgi:cell division transport system ATP-binding protein
MTAPSRPAGTAPQVERVYEDTTVLRAIDERMYPPPEPKLPMIDASGVTIRYGRHEPVLDKANFTIHSGDFTFVLGASGSGKTSLLRLLFRDVLPTEGSVVVAGQSLQRLRGRGLAHFRRQVGFVFQDFKLLPGRTVYENIGMALRVTGCSRKQVRDRVEHILPRVGLTHRRNAYPAEISGGEQQRVAIARAMVGNPMILFADEPTGNLDPHLSVAILDLFEGFNLRGTTVVIATHDTATAVERGKRVLRIEDRKVREGVR